MLNSGEDVSVVVQGPIHGLPTDPPDKQLTRRVLESVRRVWPASEIILSTWQGSDATGLPCDALLLNEDPGATPLNETTHRHLGNNINRLFISTCNGLARATRRYAVKLRTDCPMLAPVDFSLLEGMERAPEWSILERPVLTLYLSTKHPLRRPVLFFVSDLFNAGLLTDVRTLWNLPLVEEPAFSRAIDPDNRPEVTAFPETDHLARCANEQYLGEQLTLRKVPGIHLRHPGDGSAEWLEIWLRVLASNFRLLSVAESVVDLPPRLTRYETWWDMMQPKDARWLRKWARPQVPAATRWFAAKRFPLVQSAFRAPPFRRTLWQRAFGRALRATT